MRLLSRLFAVALLAFTVQGAAAMGSGSSIGGGNDDAERASDRSSYTDAERAVQRGEYREAIDLLNDVVERQPRNVDAHNYLGYSHRQLGEYRQALVHYRRALEIDPDHRGANEYLGQLYLLRNDLERAEAQLEKLERICGPGCEEYDSLNAAIQEYRRRS